MVRSACCDAVVLLVAEGHADLPFVLSSVLNLLPSARYAIVQQVELVLQPTIIYDLISR